MNYFEIISWARKGLQAEKRRQEQMLRTARRSTLNTSGAESLRDLLEHNVAELESELSELDADERTALEHRKFMDGLSQLTGREKL